MDPILDLMIDLVSSAGGVMSYNDLYQKMPAENRPGMARAFVTGKRENTLRKQIRVVEGKPVHEVYIPKR